MRRSLISVAILGLFTLPAVPTIATPVPAKVAQITTQLPRTVKPTHYDVSLVPNAAASSFTGKVRITLKK